MQATHFSVLDLLRISRLLTVCLAISMAGSAIWLTAACADEAVDTVALARDVDKSLRAAELLQQPPLQHRPDAGHVVEPGGAVLDSGGVQPETRR